MEQVNLPLSPGEAVKLILKKLSLRRSRDILEKRYGLKGGKKLTLEAIGKEYRITRERVRQIESDALKVLKTPQVAAELAPIFNFLEGYIRRHGEVMAEHYFFLGLDTKNFKPHLSFLMEIGTAFEFLPGNERYHSRWTVNKKTALAVQDLMEETASVLAAGGCTVSFKELNGLIAERIRRVFGSEPSEEVIRSYLETSKLIRPNPYGEYGLADWPNINPRGIRDKAYMVISKAGKPLHFRVVTEEINRVGWSSSSKKKANPQTVHNELIKDPRFILVGRGIYALREWGYKEGTVRDIVVRVLREAGGALPKEEIIKRVLAQRMVKMPTILLNLQNPKFFKKTEDGYRLV